MTDIPIYLIEGHGSESVIYRRDESVRFLDIPPGVTIVFLTKSSVPLMATELCKFNDFFRDPKNKEILQDPKKLRKYFKDIRIYNYPEKFPEVTTTLEIKQNEPNSYGKAGVFKFPNLPKIERADFPHISVKLTSRSKKIIIPMLSDVNDIICKDYYIIRDKYTKKIHDEIYRGSIKDVTMQQIKNKENFRLSGLIAEFGPGIYYFGGCRSEKNGLINYKMLYEIIRDSLFGIFQKIRIKHMADIRKIEDAKSSNRVRVHLQLDETFNLFGSDIDNKARLIFWNELSAHYDSLRWNSRYHDIIIKLIKLLIKSENLPATNQAELLDVLTIIPTVYEAQELYDRSDELNASLSPRNKKEKRDRSLSLSLSNSNSHSPKHILSSFKKMRFNS